MNFGQAISGMKMGGKFARKGWNGKDMFIFIRNGSAPYKDALINSVAGELFDYGDDGTSVRMPSVCLKAADNSTVVGWLASQTDMLAEDWEQIV